VLGGERYGFSAARHCRASIERLAKYQHEWTDSWHEEKFYRMRWADQAAGTVTYVGDRVKFQNGFGAWQYMTYQCTYDPIGERVLAAKAEPGRLPPS
jgi:hypothetical protein